MSLPFMNGGTIQLKVRRKLSSEECAFVWDCYHAGKSPRQTADIMQVSIRAIQTRYEIIRGRKMLSRNAKPRGPKTGPVCVIAECEDPAIKGRRTCERHAAPLPMPAVLGSFIRPLTAAEMMRWRA